MSDRIAMQYTTLGSTQLRVSVAGVGTGGNSRVGLGSGKTDKEAIALIRTAMDLGINFFDTAEVYGTEQMLGQALAGAPRDDVGVSSKSRIVDANGELLSAAALVNNLDQSLRRLSLEYLDVFHLHAVQPKYYDYVPAVLAADPDPLGFLIHGGGASSLTDAAYRFARHEPGADVILFGIGEERHLRENINSLLKPPLPQEDLEKLRLLFGHLRGVGLVFPDHMSSAAALRSI
jgi:aryl-alcohol dehydrogenase-like predicted oxidoreductase